MPDPTEISRELGVEPTISTGGRLRWWCREVTPGQERVAKGSGLVEVRRLHQMRVPLPIGATTDLPVRPFRPGVDDLAWLEVNNRAFAWHPDQGGWTPERLTSQIAEAWFDAEDFLIHEDPAGTIAGFCWTKYHRDHEPPLGEIFVIGVDPTRQARGLGRALTIAGLSQLWRHHAPPLGMLYVEHDNATAVSLYRSLGFAVHHDDVAFELADAQ